MSDNKIDGKIISDFNDYLKNKKYSELTRQLYIRNIIRMNKELKEITNKTIRKYVNKYNNQVCRSSIKLFFYYLKFEKDMFNDFNLVLPKKNITKMKEHKYLSKKEIDILFDSMDDKDFKLLSEIIFYGALRVSEAIKLKWGDLDWINWLRDSTTPLVFVIRDSKKGLEQKSIFPPSFSNKLYKLNYDKFDKNGIPYNSDYFIVYLHPRRYDTLEEYVESIRHSYKHYLKKLSKRVLGKVITPHTLRHSYAQLMYDSGIRLEVISRKLRHMNLSTTTIYAKTNISHLISATKNLKGLE